MPIEQDRLIQVVGIAELLDCSKSTVWRRVSDGTIPQPVKIGGMSRWSLSEIIDVIEKAKVKRYRVKTIYAGASTSKTANSTSANEDDV